MPEGDTVHRWAAQLDAALVGRALQRVEIRRDPRGIRPPAAGTHVTGVEAHGKHLLVRFDDGATLAHAHAVARHLARLSPACTLAPARPHCACDPRSRRRHDRGVLQRAGRGAPARRGRPCSSRALRSLEQLGPDLCGEVADVDRVLERLHDVPAETPIGDVLLDQRVAAGIGNVFKSEICWARRVHPSTPIGALPDATRRALYDTAHRQLHANLGGGRRVTYHGGLAVYGKARRPCPRCRTPIRRAWTGNDARVTYWCPTLSAATGRHACRHRGGVGRFQSAISARARESTS